MKTSLLEINSSLWQAQEPTNNCVYATECVVFPFICSLEETSYHSEAWRGPWSTCGRWCRTRSGGSRWSRSPGPGSAKTAAGQSWGPTSNDCTSRNRSTSWESGGIWRGQQGRDQGRRAGRTTKATRRYRVHCILLMNVNSNHLPLRPVIINS